MSQAPRAIRWVVRAGDGLTVGEIAARAAPKDRGALDEGRVFIGKIRAHAAAQPVRVGDTVDVFRPRPPARGAARELVRILHHADDLVVASKPAEIATVPDHHGSAGTVVDEVAKALRIAVTQIRVVSRLDVGVSGVVVFALSEAAERRLVASRARGEYQRTYLAIAGGFLPAREGIIDAPIGRDSDPRKRAIPGLSPREAVTRYVVRGRAREASLIDLWPETGRTHQLRLHLAHLGAPILGDRLYGGPLRVLKEGLVRPLARIALHARRVEIAGVLPPIEEPVPALFHELWAALDGSKAIWQDHPSLPSSSLDSALP